MIEDSGNGSPDTTGSLVRWRICNCRGCIGRLKCFGMVVSSTFDNITVFWFTDPIQTVSYSIDTTNDGIIEIIC